MPNEPQKFWDFSLQLYNREGVAAACLGLQDAYQLDVNLVLFCFWHGSAYGKVDKALLHTIIEFSTEWRCSVVQPLRNVRSWMKLNPSPDEQFESLRERIKADELMTEKYQQEKIASLTSEFNSRRKGLFGDDDIGKNIDSLLYALEIERDEKLTSRLEVIHSALSEQHAPRSR